MKLHDNQLQLLRHLARFNLMDYPDCLDLLDTTGTGDRVALSYAFRPLTKNKYVSKRKDGCVSILAKGRALFPEVTPLISAGGGAAERRRGRGGGAPPGDGGVPHGRADGSSQYPGLC